MMGQVDKRSDAVITPWETKGSTNVGRISMDLKRLTDKSFNLMGSERDDKEL